MAEKRVNSSNSDEAADAVHVADQVNEQEKQHRYGVAEQPTISQDTTTTKPFQTTTPETVDVVTPGASAETHSQNEQQDGAGELTWGSMSWRVEANKGGAELYVYLRSKARKMSSFECAQLAGTVTLPYNTLSQSGNETIPSTTHT